MTRYVLIVAALVALCLPLPLSAQQMLVASFATSGDGVTTPWAGWDSNPSLATGGCTSGVCQWAAGKRYYFQGGAYTLTNQVLIDGNNTSLVGSGKGQVNIQYVPTANGTVAFQLGKLGSLQSTFLEVSNLRIFSTGTNTYSKVAIKILDGEQVQVNNNIVDTWQGVGAVGLFLQGREFLYVDANSLNADIPVYLAGGPNSGTGLNKLGLSTLTRNLFWSLTNTNPLITIDPSAYLEDVQISGNSYVGGSHGVYWVGTPTVLSKRLLIERIRWERMSDTPGQANGYFALIDLTGASPLVGLTIRDAAYGALVTPTSPHVLGGLRARNVTKITLDMFTNIGATSGPYLDVNNEYPVIIRNGFASPGNAPVLGSSLCYTFKSPPSVTFISGFANALPADAELVIDHPSDSTKCLP